MSTGDLHQSTGTCLLNPEPSTDPFGMPSLKIEEHNVEDVNQKYGTLHVEETEGWKGQEGNSLDCIPRDSDFIACDNCADESNDACAFCCTCTEFLCKVCHESHKRLRKLSQHNVIQFDKETGKQLQSITKAVKQLCSQPNHNKYLTHYCDSCKCLICQDCSDCVHKGHTIFLLTSVENGDQCESEKNIALAQDIMTKLITATENNDSMIQQLETRRQICSQDVKSAFESLQRALKIRENELLAKLECIASSKMLPLMWLKKECEKMALNSKQLTEMISCGQITVALAELQRIQLTVDNHCVPRDEETTLKVLLHVNDIAEQLSQLGDVLGSSPSPSNSIWSAESVAKVNVNYRVEVETRSTNHVRYTYGGLKVIAMLTSKANKWSVIAGQVDDYEDGTYTVIFNVSVAGTYQLQILMDGQHIKRSPSDIEVLDYYAFFNLQKVIPVSKPQCIALDNQENIYALHSANISIFDKAGQLKNKVKMNGIVNIMCITVKGNLLYLISPDTIRKLTLEGKMICSVQLQIRVEGANSAVVDSHNRVIVSDNKKIQIFNEDGVWLLSIDGTDYGFRATRCVALDPKGNIHVCSNSNAIIVFTPQGTFYRMYGDVKDPTGIAVDKKGYSIVCETGGSLTVFHPHGNKVYSTRNPNQPLVPTPHIYDLSSPQVVALDQIGSTLCVAYISNIIVFSFSS